MSTGPVVLKLPDFLLLYCNFYRFGFAAFGTLLGAGAALPIVGLFSDKNTGYTALGILYGFLMMVTALITVFTVKEPDSRKKRLQSGFVSTYLKVFRNRPFLLILLTYALHITAITIIAGVAIYYFKYIHQNEAATTLAMVIMLLTAMLFIPVSVLLAKRIDKKLSYGIGMAVFSVAVMVLFFTGHLFGLTYALAIFFFIGIGMGFLYALPYAMVPDAIEYGYLLTGERTEGAFYATWTFGMKIGQAVALGITGWVLSAVGYVPNVTQTDLSMLGIRLLLGPITVTIFVMAMVALYFYPINEQRYNQILSRIDEMEKKGRGN